MKPGTGARLYVTAPVNALVEGIYQQDSTTAEILARGDFGIGTFNQLDGEMVVRGGRVFQLHADGSACAAAPQTRTPFACVTFFRPYSVDEIAEPLAYDALLALLDRLLPSRNMVYAIAIDGLFAQLRTRSVARQETSRPLVEVAREQVVSEFAAVDGHLVGFWTPHFLQSIVPPGYHFHFIDRDATRGGHLLDCRVQRVRISVQHVGGLELGLPLTLDYLTADLSRDIRADLAEAEK